MALSAGDKLGPYEIVSRLGKGGMGEVWKARDPRLGREVAIKVSAQQFTDRFEREARAVALFDAHMPRDADERYFEYDVTADGKRFLVNVDGTGGAMSAPPLTVVTNWLAGVRK